MTAPAPLLDRLRALPLDRAPLRRAAVLAALLVALLVAGRWVGPAAPAPSAAEAQRQNVQAGAEEASALRPAPDPTAWTAGRGLALALLAAGGGAALWLRRRRADGATPSAAAFETLATEPLAGGHALRLVSCGGDVLLLGVGPEGARLLRHWPRADFDAAPAPEALPPDASPARFADVLAGVGVAAADAAPPAVVEIPAAPPALIVPSVTATPPASVETVEVAAAGPAVMDTAPAEAAPPRPTAVPSPSAPVVWPRLAGRGGAAGGDGVPYAPADAPAGLPQFLAARG